MTITEKVVICRVESECKKTDIMCKYKVNEATTICTSQFVYNN